MSAYSNSTKESSFPLAKIIESLDALAGNECSAIIHDVIGEEFYKRESKLGDAIEPLEQQLMKAYGLSDSYNIHLQVVTQWATHTEDCMRMAFAHGVAFAMKQLTGA